MNKKFSLPEEISVKFGVDRSTADIQFYESGIHFQGY
jgi:hypothetical protein